MVNLELVPAAVPVSSVPLAWSLTGPCPAFADAMVARGPGSGGSMQPLTQSRPEPCSG